MVMTDRYYKDRVALLSRNKIELAEPHERRSFRIFGSCPLWPCPLTAECAKDLARLRIGASTNII
jgi:hypothetical protein